MQNSPSTFLTALVTANGSTGGNSTAAKAVYAKALRATAGGSPSSGLTGSIGEIGSPMSLLSGLSNAAPSKIGAINNVLALAMDYDLFYLGEHTMYGSSRLGIKKYWPNQYRYEWNKSKTVAQNNASLDSSELVYRIPWYYKPWQSLMSAKEVDPIGHAQTGAVYTSRIVGQKAYELTNHLGNVMAVVSDKVTEKPVSGNPPTLAVKRAGLSAAYDYYPFGMQMPGRIVEDATVQCVPVSKYRKVDQIVSSQNVLAIANPSAPSYNWWNKSAGSTNVTPLPQQGGGYYAQLTSNAGVTTLDGSLTFQVLPAAASGFIADITFTTNDYPSITGYDRGCILAGTLFVELRNLASGGTGTFLVTASRLGAGTIRLIVPPGMVKAGDAIRLWQHYDAGAVLNRCVYNYTTQAQITYTSVVSNVLKPVDQQYVVLSCDTDGAYTAGYRYGFNGQQKDEEIAGKGNHNTALFWEYDMRLGRRWNVDPILIYLKIRMRS
jgi:hypothetical protein